MVWKHTGLQLSPLISVAQAQTQLASGTFTANTLTGQYGGRLAWAMPRWLKFTIVAGYIQPEPRRREPHQYADNSTGRHLDRGAGAQKDVLKAGNRELRIVSRRRIE